MTGTMSPLLVLGATGAIGTRLVARAAAAGRRTIAVARDAAALAALRERHGATVLPLAATLCSDADAAALADRVAALAGPRPGAVVAAIRGAAPARRLLDAPADFLRRRLDEDLLPHLAAARHLLPLLAPVPGGAYVLVGGPGAEQPWSGYGHRSIGAAALQMLARVLHEEARTLPVRVQMLAIDSPVRTAHNAAHACTQWPDADAIADYALRMVDGRLRPDAALLRFPSEEPVRPPGLSDDIDLAAAPCLPASTHDTAAQALLQRIAARSRSPQEFRS
ncbi:SDR family NAD(P)-dependent oxidoreductase [Luteimonas sp. TWI1437]|uniref:SDR family NAD(P)-dependent oxidoreductase n=1 Tax=unclassified Luteimonas TaxID=2629088 RepID=UPI00320A98B0